MFTPSRDRGASAVEFALVLPILLLLVLGIIEFGRAYHLQTTLSNAARDGVRVMALENSVSKARSTAKASAKPLNLTDSDMKFTNELGRPLDDCTAASEPGTVSMTIEYPFSLVSGFLPIGDITLTGKGSMRCLG